MSPFSFDQARSLLPLFYFNLRNAYVDGRKQECQKWISALSNCTVSSRAELDEIFTPAQLNDLVHITTAVESNIYMRGVRDPDPSDVDVASCRQPLGRPLETERQLQDMLAENSECFEQLARLAAPGMVLHDIEHRVSEGRVDLLGKAGRDMVVIELKRDTGDHRLVGQCLQYLDHFERRLLWGLWDRVIGVTVAHQYTKFALKELSRLGLTAIRYGVNEKGNLLLGKA